MAEPILNIYCRSCKSLTEHALSKNVKGEFEYICLKCGREVAMRDAREANSRVEFVSSEA